MRYIFACFSFLLLLISWKGQGAYPVEARIVLECSSPCNAVITVSDFLKSGHIFSNKRDVLVVEDSGLNVFEMPLEDYLEIFWIPNDGYPTKSNTKPELKRAEPIYRTFDAALDCRYDRDYSCADWYSDYRYSDYLIEAQSIVLGTEIRVFVTQSLIDSNEEAMAYAVTAATIIPAGRLVSFITKYGTSAEGQLLLKAISGTIISVQLSKLSSSSVKRTLKVGDILVFYGGNVSIIREDGSTELLFNGLDLNSDTGSNIGGGGEFQPPTYPPGAHLGGGLCNAYGTVCTGGGCLGWVETVLCDNHP